MIKTIQHQITEDLVEYLKKLGIMHQVYIDWIQDFLERRTEELLQYDRQRAYTKGYRRESLLSRIRDYGRARFESRGNEADQLLTEIGKLLDPESSSPTGDYGWIATHLKTDKVYLVVGEAINTTNAQQGQEVVIYEREGKTYVREVHEFQDTFSGVETERTVPTQPVAACPRCKGTGDIVVLSDNSPDAYDVEVTCPHCGGDGTLEAAYNGLEKLFQAEHEKYMGACAKLYSVEKG